MGWRSGIKLRLSFILQILFRQEHGVAVRRVIQPKIIEEKPVSRDQRSSQLAEYPSEELAEVHRGRTASNETVVKVCGWRLFDDLVFFYLYFKLSNKITFSQSGLVL